jgi:uncharacterized iron-regulated membrane protein
VKTGTWRRVWLNVHLWIGVGLLILLAPLGLSGSALVWDVQLDRMLSPSHYVAPTDKPALGAAAYLAAGQGAFGERAKVTQVRFPYNPGDPVVVNGRVPGKVQPGRPTQTLNAWLDPATGKALDVGNPRATPIGVIHQLHGNLLLAQPGRGLVGWLGLAMAISSLTGLWLWWPRGAFLAGFGWRRGPHAFSNLHHLGGFWMCLPLLVLSLTGAYIAFPKQSHALVGAPPPPSPVPMSMTGEPGKPHAERSGPPAPLALTADGAVDVVLKANPGAGLVSVSPPTSGVDKARWRIQITGAGTNPRNFTVDDASGEVQEAKGGAPTPGGPNGQDPVSRQIRQVHSGDDTPTIWRWLITLAGVAPTALGVTGVVIWLRRPRRPKLRVVADA